MGLFWITFRYFCLNIICRSIQQFFKMLHDHILTGDKLKEKPANMKCLSKVSGYYIPPQLYCTLALILQVSELFWRDEHHLLPKDIPSFDVLMMVVESAV